LRAPAADAVAVDVPSPLGGEGIAEGSANSIG
jgi:hypothetical protein